MTLGGDLLQSRTRLLGLEEGNGRLLTLAAASRLYSDVSEPAGFTVTPARESVACLKEG